MLDIMLSRKVYRMLASFTNPVRKWAWSSNRWRGNNCRFLKPIIVVSFQYVPAYTTAKLTLQLHLIEVHLNAVHAIIPARDKRESLWPTSARIIGLHL